MTTDPVYSSYINGKLTLADIDLSTPLPDWLDSVYALYCEAPHELLEKMNKQMVINTARLRPEEARETWGLRPEHVAMAGQLGRGAGAEAGGRHGAPPVAVSAKARRNIAQYSQPPAGGRGAGRGGAVK
jgi:hypothetical protein